MRKERAQWMPSIFSTKSEESVLIASLTKTATVDDCTVSDSGLESQFSRWSQCLLRFSLHRVGAATSLAERTEIPVL